MGADFCKVLQKKHFSGLFRSNLLIFVDIKLTEVWKTLHKSDYPIQLEKKMDGGGSTRTLRPGTTR